MTTRYLTVSLLVAAFAFPGLAAAAPPKPGTSSAAELVAPGPDTPAPPPNEESEPEPEPTPEPELPPTFEDHIELVDGQTLEARVSAIEEGDYVTFTTSQGTQTLPWAEVRRVIVARGEHSFDLHLDRPSFEPEQPATAETPHIQILTRDGKPVSLLRLRDSGDSVKKRFSSGFDEICRAPCETTVERGIGRFFVDTHPWTTSKIFELPEGESHLRLLVRPGRVNLRKAGAGLMIAGAIAFPIGIALLGTGQKGVVGTGIGLSAVGALAIPTGAIMFGVSRSRVKVQVSSPGADPASSETTPSP